METCIESVLWLVVIEIGNAWVWLADGVRLCVGCLLGLIFVSQNSIQFYWLQNAVIGEKPYNSLELGNRGLSNKITFGYTSIQHASGRPFKISKDGDPTTKLATCSRVQRSASRKRISFGSTGNVCAVTSKCVLGGWNMVAERRALVWEDSGKR